MNIEGFWRDVLSQDSEKLAAFFAPDAVIRWHCSNEQFTGDEFIRANCDYPGEWDGKIERIEALDEQIITVVNVFPKNHSASFHVVSFFKIKDDKISSLDEYWADDGDAPEWRKSMRIGRPIRNNKRLQ